jgi:hypothetical protein
MSINISKLIRDIDNTPILASVARTNQRWSRSLQLHDIYTNKISIPTHISNRKSRVITKLRSVDQKRTDSAKLIAYSHDSKILQDSSDSFIVCSKNVERIGFSNETAESKNVWIFPKITLERISGVFPAISRW